MLTITNGRDTFNVSRGAYNGIFKQQGYSIIGEDNAGAETAFSDPVDEVAESEEKSEDQLFIEEVQEKPLTRWSKSEVKRFAALMGIDLAGTQSFEEAKERVKAYISK